LNPPTVSLGLVATGGGGPAGDFKPLHMIIRKILNLIIIFDNNHH
jgi:hypothetical protein